MGNKEICTLVCYRVVSHVSGNLLLGKASSTSPAGLSSRHQHCWDQFENSAQGAVEDLKLCRLEQVARTEVPPFLPHMYTGCLDTTHFKRRLTLWNSLWGRLPTTSHVVTVACTEHLNLGNPGTEHLSRTKIVFVCGGRRKSRSLLVRSHRPTHVGNSVLFPEGGQGGVRIIFS